MWTSTEGVCYGLPGGTVKNLTIDKYIMPEGIVAASLINTNVNGEGYAQNITTIR